MLLVAFWGTTGMLLIANAKSSFILNFSCVEVNGLFFLQILFPGRFVLQIGAG